MNRSRQLCHDQKRVQRRTGATRVGDHETGWIYVANRDAAVGRPPDLRPNDDEAAWRLTA